METSPEIMQEVSIQIEMIGDIEDEDEKMSCTTDERYIPIEIIGRIKAVDKTE